MSNIQQNTKAAQEAFAELHAHPMAARVSMDRSHLLVVYPVGYRLDGVRVSLANGKRWAAEQALNRMESEWLGSLPGAAS